MWKRRKRATHTRAHTYTQTHKGGNGVRHEEKALQHVTAVDVLTLSHGRSESYSPRTQCSSCIRICLPSRGHGAETGQRESSIWIPIGLSYFISAVLHGEQSLTRFNVWLTWSSCVVSQLQEMHVLMWLPVAERCCGRWFIMWQRLLFLLNIQSFTFFYSTTFIWQP